MLSEESHSQSLRSPVLRTLYHQIVVRSSHHIVGMQYKYSQNVVRRVALSIFLFSGASHPVQSEKSHLQSEVSFRKSHSQSLRSPFRGYRFAQPPVIESLHSPVLRTQCSQNPYHTIAVGVSCKMSSDCRP